MDSPTPPIAEPSPRPAQLNRFLRPFSRTTSTGQLIPELDGLRCLAILSVIAFHIAGYVAEKSPQPFTSNPQQDPLFRLARTGHIGVQLFFIISGFVVAIPFARRHLAAGPAVNLRYYYLRRLTRIEPPYIIALIFWLFAFGLSGLGQAPWPVLLHHFPASLFYLHNAIYHSPSYVLPPAWSLEIEVQFYLIAPLLAVVFTIPKPLFRRAILLAGMIAACLLQPLIRPPDLINGLHLVHEIQYFLIGLLLLDFYYVPIQNPIKFHPLIWDALAAIAVMTLVLLLQHNPAAYLSIPPLLAIITAAAFRSQLFRALLRRPLIYTFGGMCYTVYLYHGFFKALPGHYTIQLQVGHTYWLNFLIQLAILLPIIIVGSAGLFLLTEKPFMRRDWPRRLAARFHAKIN